MPGYKELREEYEITTSQNSVEGVRAFIDLTTGTADLPNLGDPISVTYPACLCRSIHAEKYHVKVDMPDGCPKDGIKYICNYSTNEEGEVLRPIIDRDDDQFVFTAGNEVWSIEDPDFWYWQPESAGTFTTGNVKQRLFKNTIRGTISKTITKDADGNTFHYNGNDFVVYINAQVLPKLGKINKYPFIKQPTTSDPATYLFKTGTVLFSSYSGKQVKDEDGDRIWEITLNWAYRILNVGTHDNVVNSWFYLLRKDKYSDGENDWQEVCKLETPTNTEASLDKDYLYKRVDFMGLIAHKFD